MATIKGILGQAAPSAAADTDLYACPDNKHATIKVVIANRSGATSIRVWVAVDGAATESKQYIAYEQALAGNDAISTVSVMIGGQDVVRVRAASANVSFTCTGIEQDG